MPDNAEPELDTSSAANADASMEAIANAASFITGTIAGVLDNPCANETDLNNRMMIATRFNNLLVSGTTWWAESNQNAVRAAMRNWGRGASGATGGEPFGTWLINHYTIDAIPEPSAHLVVRHNLRDGRGNNKPSRSNSGFKLGPGIYIGPNRTMQGTRVVQAWEQWAHLMRTQWVHSPGTGRVHWRERLLAWAGRTTDDWRIWVPGTPVLETSRIGRNWQAIEALKDQRDAMAAACAFRVRSQVEIQLGGQDIQEQLIEGEVEKSRLAAATDQQKALLTAAAAFGIAWVALRGR